MDNGAVQDFWGHTEHHRALRSFSVQPFTATVCSQIRPFRWHSKKSPSTVVILSKTSQRSFDLVLSGCVVSPALELVFEST